MLAEVLLGSGSPSPLPPPPSPSSLSIVMLAGNGHIYRDSKESGAMYPFLSDDFILHDLVAVHGASAKAANVELIESIKKKLETNFFHFFRKGVSYSRYLKQDLPAWMLTTPPRLIVLRRYS